MTGTGKSPESYQTEDFVTDESFVNYFFRLNAEDVVFWEKWLLANPGCQESVDAAKEMIRNLTLTLTDQEIIEQTAKMKKAIGHESKLIPRKRPGIIRLLQFGHNRRFWKGKRKKSIAVILPLLALLVGGWFFLNHFILAPDRTIEKFNDGNNPIVFSLADGTTVTLAAQSALHYTAGFGKKERDVFLNGEARFDVARKSDYPFRVHEGDIVATVLGTIFNVKKQSGDSVMVVELIKGKLKVENLTGTGLPLKSITLNPDERVVYTRHDQRLYKERWQPQVEFPLQVGHIAFQRDNFDGIARKIKAAFGVNVVNQSKKRDWMFSGEFENTTAKEIIENICVVEKLIYQMKGDTLFIK
jgi:ferric-dicitrate binding protein FerR (iron transport regulator)